MSYNELAVQNLNPNYTEGPCAGFIQPNTTLDYVSACSIGEYGIPAPKEINAIAINVIGTSASSLVGAELEIDIIHCGQNNCTWESDGTVTPSKTIIKSVSLLISDLTLGKHVISLPNNVQMGNSSGTARTITVAFHFKGASGYVILNYFSVGIVSGVPPNVVIPPGEIVVNPSSPSSSSNTIIYIAVGGLILAGIIGASYFLLNRKGKK